MLITRRKNHLPPHALCVDGQPLEQVNSFRYLGVVISSNLSWSRHIEVINSRAKKLLGLIYRQFSQHANCATLLRIYEALVRPHVEYAAQVWDPHLQKDKILLEGVQKYALRICSKQWHLSYDELLQKFHVPKLSTRRLYFRLATMFQIIYNGLHFPRGIILPRNSCLIMLSHISTSNPLLTLSHIFTHSFLKQYLTGTPYLNILLLACH